MPFLRRRALPFFLIATGALRAADPTPQVEVPAEPPALAAPDAPVIALPKLPKLRGTLPTLRVPMGTATKTIASDGKLELISLREALGRAFEHNLDAKFDKVDIKIDQARLRYALGVFDPVFTASATRDNIQRPDDAANLTSGQTLVQLTQIAAIQANTKAVQTATRQPVTAALQPPSGTIVFDAKSDRVESGIQFRTPFGTRLQVTARQAKTTSTFEGDTRKISPFYTAFGGVEVRQPLLKDFGPSANLADVRSARVNLRVAEMDWEKRLSETAQQVTATYFDMLFGLADLAVKQDAIAADEKLTKQNERRMQLGFMSPFDVQVARAAVSQDREQLLVAKNNFMERQFLLKRLILDDYKLGTGQVFVPLAIPDLPIPKINRTALLATAFEKRLDYRAAITAAEVNDIRLKFAKNQLWPQLDLVGSYGWNGLDFGYGDARSKVFHSQAPEWSVGFQLSIPIGGVQPRAQLRAIEGFKEQALIKIKQIEQTVSIDVDTVISRIETLQQRLDTARQTTSLNEEAVRIALRKLDEGLISSFDVIETQRRLYDARSRELGARSELNKAISQLWLATGTILEEAHITIKK